MKVVHNEVVSERPEKQLVHFYMSIQLIRKETLNNYPSQWFKTKDIHTYIHIVTVNYISLAVLSGRVMPYH